MYMQLLEMGCYTSAKEEPIKSVYLARFDTSVTLISLYNLNNA